MKLLNSLWKPTSTTEIAQYSGSMMKLPMSPKNSHGSGSLLGVGSAEARGGTGS